MGEARRFWTRPSVRQYWHKGLIWRASSTAEVGAIELFVDLLYVGIIALVGDRAAEEPTGESLLRFCVTFILSWRLWSDLTMVSQFSFPISLYIATKNTRLDLENMQAVTLRCFGNTSR